MLLVHSLHDHTVNLKMSEDLSRHLRAAHYPVTEGRVPGKRHVVGSPAWPYEDRIVAARIAAIEKAAAR